MAAVQPPVFKRQSCCERLLCSLLFSKRPAVVSGCRSTCFKRQSCCARLSMQQLAGCQWRLQGCSHVIYSVSTPLASSESCMTRICFQHSGQEAAAEEEQAVRGGCLVVSQGDWQWFAVALPLIPAAGQSRQTVKHGLRCRFTSRITAYKLRHTYQFSKQDVTMTGDSVKLPPGRLPCWLRALLGALLERLGLASTWTAGLNSTGTAVHTTRAAQRLSRRISQHHIADVIPDALHQEWLKHTHPGCRLHARPTPQCLAMLDPGCSSGQQVSSNLTVRTWNKHCVIGRKHTRPATPTE